MQTLIGKSFKLDFRNVTINRNSNRMRAFQVRKESFPSRNNTIASLRFSFRYGEIEEATLEKAEKDEEIVSGVPNALEVKLQKAGDS